MTTGVLIGVGMMAAVDEIVFHQLLAWHHFYDRSTSAVALLSDGLLHSAELIVRVAGFFMLAELPPHISALQAGQLALLVVLAAFLSAYLIAAARRFRTDGRAVLRTLSFASRHPADLHCDPAADTDRRSRRFARSWVQLHFLVSGYRFVWSIAGPDPAPHRPRMSTRLSVLFVATAAHATLAKLMYAHECPRGAGTLWSR